MTMPWHLRHRRPELHAGGSNAETRGPRQLLGRQHDRFSFLSGTVQHVSPATLAPVHAYSAVRVDTRRTRPSGFFLSTAATKYSQTNLLGA